MKIHTLDDLKKVGPSVALGVFKTFSFRTDLLKYMKEFRNRRSGDRTTKSFACGPCEGTGMMHEHPRSVDVFHPSSFGPYGCRQRLWFDLYGTVEEISIHDPELLLIFDVGHQLHDMLQTYAERMYGDDFEREVRAKDADGLISGSADGRWTFPKIRVIQEIKTINRKGFEALSKPKPEHLWQAMTYAKMLDIPFILFVYICKDNSQIVEYHVLFDEEIWADVEAFMDSVLDCPDEEGPGAINAMGKVVNKFTCKGCGYRHSCKFSQFAPPRRRKTR